MPTAVPPSVSRFRLRAALLVLTVAAPAAAYAQASGSVLVRATVAAADAPRLGVSLAASPLVTRGPAAVGDVVDDAVGDVVGSSAARAGVEVTTSLRIDGNARYRLLVRARPGVVAPGLAVRDAAGVFRPLAGGVAVEVVRGEGGKAPRAVVYRLNDEPTAGPSPVVYELVYEPVG